MSRDVAVGRDLMSQRRGDEDPASGDARRCRYSVLGTQDLVSQISLRTEGHFSSTHFYFFFQPYEREGGRGVCVLSRGDMTGGVLSISILISRYGPLRLDGTWMIRGTEDSRRREARGVGE